MTADLIGPELAAALKRIDLTRRQTGAIMRKMLAAGDQVIVRAAKPLVPPGPSGTLKRALGRKEKIFRQGERAGKGIGIVGARRGIQRTIAWGKKQRLFSATRYAHLAGPQRKATFLARAADSSAAQVADAMAAKAAQEIAKL